MTAIRRGARTALLQPGGEATQPQPQRWDADGSFLGRPLGLIECGDEIVAINDTPLTGRTTDSPSPSHSLHPLPPLGKTLEEVLQLAASGPVRQKSDSTITHDGRFPQPLKLAYRPLPEAMPDSYRTSLNSELSRARLVRTLSEGVRSLVEF